MRSSNLVPLHHANQRTVLCQALGFVPGGKGYLNHDIIGAKNLKTCFHEQIAIQKWRWVADAINHAFRVFDDVFDDPFRLIA